jgi:murein DD-endopeptidase MepM/ murein hydrolase activator NlpD
LTNTLVDTPTVDLRVLLMYCIEVMKRFAPKALLSALLFALTLGSAAAQEDLVTVYGEDQPDGSVVLRATSNHVIPVYLSVDLPQLINMQTDVDLPFGIQLDPGASGAELFELEPTPGARRIGYAISYSYARGNPFTANHDDDYAYLMPFEHGTKRRLSQGFGGRFSHYGENEYAVDFEMPIGTPIHAARDGIVAEVKEDSNRGGASASYSGDGNYILIAHTDGSFGNYVHLRQNGAVVDPGDRVTAGTLIGYSGNTGRSSGPHLHFDVRIPTEDGRMQSIPFRFRGEDAPFDPEGGLFYYSFHPGGQEFEVVLGREITETQYVDHAMAVAATGEVEVRIDQVDLTYIVFIRNGLQREIDAELGLQLAGMSSTAGRTVVLAVPAQTELFVSILRPVPGASRIQYGYTLRYR